MNQQILKPFRWILGSVGVAGVLIGIGFVIDASQQDFLGFQFRPLASIPEYVAAAGQFGIDTTSAVAAILAQNTMAVVVVVVTAVVLLVVPQRVRRRRVKPKTARRIRIPIYIMPAAGIFTVGLAFLALDAPALQLQNLLTRDLDVGVSLSGRGVVGRAARHLWIQHVCSRVAAARYHILADADIECWSEPERHRRVLRNWFLLDLAFAVLGFLMATWAIAHPPARGSEPVLLHGYRYAVMTLLGLALLDCVMLPYSYGKTLRATTANEVVVRTDGAVGSEPLHAFLLGEDDRRLVLFLKNAEQILLLSKSHVVSIRVERSDDVLSFHLRESVERLRVGKSIPSL